MAWLGLEIASKELVPVVSHNGNIFVFFLKGLRWYWGLHGAWCAWAAT